MLTGCIFSSSLEAFKDSFLTDPCFIPLPESESERRTLLSWSLSTLSKLLSSSISLSGFSSELCSLATSAAFFDSSFAFTSTPSPADCNSSFAISLIVSSTRFSLFFLRRRITITKISNKIPKLMINGLLVKICLISLTKRTSWPSD